MRDRDAISAHDGEAATYDEAAAECEWYAHDLLFGMAYEAIRPGQTLLDLGIGTGLASWSFARAGLVVTGVDGSPEMLQAVRAKGFADELVEFDLSSGPLPFDDASFDHAVCCGVLHFIRDISGIIAEVSRLLRPGGLFAFTNRTFDPHLAQGTSLVERGVVEKIVEGVSIYVHGDEHVERWLSASGFLRMKRASGIVKMPESPTGHLTYRAWLVKKA